MLPPAGASLQLVPTFVRLSLRRVPADRPYASADVRWFGSVIRTTLARKLPQGLSALLVDAPVASDHFVLKNSFTKARAFMILVRPCLPRTRRSSSPVRRTWALPALHSASR